MYKVLEPIKILNRFWIRDGGSTYRDIIEDYEENERQDVELDQPMWIDDFISCLKKDG